MSLSFHPGELRAQSAAGTRGVAEELAPALSTTLLSPQSLNALFSQINLLPIASVSRTSFSTSIWVSIIFGSHFIHASPYNSISVELHGLPHSDVLFSNILTDPSVGCLAIQFQQRRRFRFNGYANFSNHDPTKQMHLAVDIKEAFPNCPKYIQARSVTLDTVQLPPIPSDLAFETSQTLSAEDKLIISNADTLFLGTFNAPTGADVNHRGGRPGFVRVVGESEMLWGDYRGNGMFQSFGNLELDNRAGVTFVDFETGCTLQLSGSADVEWGDVDESLRIEAGAVRIVRFHIDNVRRSVGPATNYRWTRPGYSPYNPVLPGGRDGNLSHEGFPMRVSLVKIVTESPVVKTFRFLSPRKVSFLPGQYATFDFGVIAELAASPDPIVRTWTLSEAANSTKGDVTLEVSVKRKRGGLMSNWLHDCAEIGMEVSLLGIGGHMTPFEGPEMPEKFLLISGGIGITPNMAIVRALGAILDPEEMQPSVVMVHQERYIAEMPFQGELERRERVSGGDMKVVRVVSGGGGGESCVMDGEKKLRIALGRVSVELLKSVVADVEERKVYLCGPVAFMESVTGTLVSMGVSADNIVTEQFNF